MCVGNTASAENRREEDKPWWLRQGWCFACSGHRRVQKGVMDSSSISPVSWGVHSLNSVFPIVRRLGTTSCEHCSIHKESRNTSQQLCTQFSFFFSFFFLLLLSMSSCLYSISATEWRILSTRKEWNRN